MNGRDGVMSREDGSDLREDKLRLPKLSVEKRSAATKTDPLSLVSPAHQADNGIQTFHNLMRAFDSMVLSDDRRGMRLHLSAEFVLIRGLLEAANTALWVLGPEESDERIARSLRLRYTEISYSRKLAMKFTELAGPDAQDAFIAQERFVNGQLADLATMATDAGLEVKRATKPISPSTLASEAGTYVPGLGDALGYWYWSTASSIAHGEPANMRELADMTFIGVDVRDEPVAQVDPSAVAIWNHLKVAHDIITAAHVLWNHRAAAQEA
ncbi:MULTISPECIES: hypothetical protein [Actinomycetes]|uniref:hypothetical protein n=1 Tax=Actinomycetes TaxID=1760 RepID=UPI0010A76CC2|nr:MULTISPECIES: hypothetical protein [Actinomycetes]